MTTMKIEVHETPKAFRVNGVTFAKKYLRELFSGDDVKDDTRLHMYLATVPDVYLSGAAETLLENTKDGAAKYGAAKAMRLWNALKLTPGTAKVFSRAAVEMAGEEGKKHVKRRMNELLNRLQVENPELYEKVQELREAVGDKPKSKADFVGDADGNNVIQFPKKPTLH